MQLPGFNRNYVCYFGKEIKLIANGERSQVVPSMLYTNALTRRSKRRSSYPKGSFSTKISKTA
jgi:hypothetical protein